MKNLLKAVLFAFAGLILFSGCSPQKKLQRAKQMVLLDPTARHDVFLTELQFFPCANDSVIQIVPAEIDSVTFAEYLKFINGALQTPTIRKDSLPILLKEAYQLGYEDASNKYLSVKVPLCKPNVVRVTVTDRQKEKILTDSLSQVNLKYSLLVGQIGQQSVYMAKQDKKITGWIWLFVGSTVLFVVTLILALLGTIKKIFP